MKGLFMVAVLAGVAVSAPAQECAGGAMRAALLERAHRDQEARKALTAKPGAKELSARVLQIDSANTAFMRGLLTSCGWPRLSVVGNEAATAAWLIIQHADADPQFQVEAAQQMRYAVLGKEANGTHLALLVDRHRRLTHQPQVYGMQTYVGRDGVVRFFDIVTPGRLETRREEIGLTPFFCHALEVSRENGNAPLEWPAGVLFTPVSCPSAK